MKNITAIIYIFFLLQNSNSYSKQNSKTSITKKVNSYPKQPLKISIPKDVYIDYNKFLQTRKPLQIKSYKGEHSRRDVVEVILLQKALAHGGNKRKVAITTPSSSYQRILKELTQGSADVSGTSIWIDSLSKKDDVLLSSPIIQKGEFEAGIYISKNHKKIKIDKISTLSFVSNEQWIVDWKTLKNLKLKVFNTTKWINMVQQVYSQRIDATLAPFSSKKDLSLTITNNKNKYTLVPIKGVKIQLQSSRHFAISKKSKQLLSQINKGIKILRKQKEISRAYQESGFFNPIVKNWKTLKSILTKQ
jgi:hypothetical protein